MRNVVEDVVKLLYDELRGSVAEFCGCELCREDVLVYALNRMAPHYVATLKGEVLTRLELLGDQRRADASIALMEGFRAVAAAPRCGRVRPAMS
jgi:competence protein ComFB